PQVTDLDPDATLPAEVDLRLRDAHDALLDDRPTRRREGDRRRVRVRLRIARLLLDRERQWRSGGDPRAGGTWVGGHAARHRDGDRDRRESDGHADQTAHPENA